MSIRSRRGRFAAALTAALAVPLLGTPVADAATTNATFLYKGTSTDTIEFFDVFVYISGCPDASDDPVTCLPDGFPGTAWARVRAGVHSTVISAQSAEFSLDGPDAFRASSSAPFTTTLNAVDASGKEVVLRTTPYVNADLAYDEPFADCAKDTFTSGPQITATDSSNKPSCIDFIGHTGNIDIVKNLELLAKDTSLPYTGTRALSETASSPKLDIGALIGLPPDLVGVRLDFVTDLLLKATQGYNAQRLIQATDGTTLSSIPYQWTSNAPQDDTATLSCAAPVGENLVYKLQNNRWEGTGDATGTLKLVIVTPFGDPSFDLFDAPLYDAPVLSTANDYSKVLGEIRGENKAPTVGVAPISGGTEGAPIDFQVVGTGPGGSFDNCSADGAGLAYHWHFDDGSQAFGRTVSHVFTDNNGQASRSGHVVVTDAAGNSRDLDFVVPVANAAPVTEAGPDTTATWGRSVVFSGTATDPGSGDQSTLSYRWSFGDGSPSATGGPTVAHEYAAPGDYTATLTACDKDGACSSDVRTVTVRKRIVSLGYTGDQRGAYDTAASFAASLVDEFGQAVPGRQVALALGSEPVGTAATNSAGTASKAHVIGVNAGTHPVTASFAGDALYVAATSAAESFTVATKGTRTTYTGATSGKPNKIVSLSANVVDATGTPLAGRVVTFVLGSQTATATTDTSGNASTLLKLAQKNGTYPLTATYAPSGSDAGRYAGSAQGVTFSLQA